MKFPNEEKTNQILKYSIIVALIVGTFYLAAAHVFPIIVNISKVALPLILPFILGAILAVLLEPAIAFFATKMRGNRGLATITVLTLTVVALVGALAGLIAKLVIEITNFAVRLPNVSENIDEWAVIIESFYNDFIGTVIDAETLESTISSVITYLTDFAYVVLDALIAFVQGTPLVILIILFTLIATYFFCKEKDSFINFVMRLFPVKNRGQVLEVWESSMRAFSGYIRATLILMLITTILTIVGLTIVNSEYAVSLGILTGIVDVLPIFGPAAVLVPLAIYSYLKNGLAAGIGVLVVYIVVTLVRNLSQPKLVSDNIGLHPLWTLLAIFVGLQLWGFLGMILFPIFLVVIKSAISAFKNEKSEN